MVETGKIGGDAPERERPPWKHLHQEGEVARLLPRNRCRLRQG